LIWEEDRESLLAHPDAIELPLEQITDGRTVVAERDGELLGFSVVCDVMMATRSSMVCSSNRRNGGKASAACWSSRPSRSPHVTVQPISG
jgi:hypothetical protein